MNRKHHRTTRRAFAGLVAAATLALPAQAAAAQAEVGGGALSVVGGSEASNITVSQLGGDLVVADPGLGVDAGAGCWATGTPAKAVCPATGVKGLLAALGDGDDSFDSSGVPIGAAVYGGNGNDQIATGNRPDLIGAGAGDDSILARDGAVDGIYCGPGADSGQADADDSLSSDCEGAVERSTTVAGSPPPADGANPPASGETTGENAAVDGRGNADAGGAVSGRAPVVITVPAAIVLSPRGGVRIGLTCTADAGSCRGTIELIESNGTLKARSVVTSARRRKAVKKPNVLGRSKFTVPAGTTKNVTVRLDRRGRQRIIRKQKKKRKTRAKLVITVRAPDGTLATSEKNVTLTLPKRRTVR